MDIDTHPRLGPAVAAAVAAHLARRLWNAGAPTGYVTEWTQTNYDGPRSYSCRFARVEFRVQYKPRGRFYLSQIDFPID